MTHHFLLHGSLWPTNLEKNMKPCFPSYASQVSPPITHNQRVPELDIFISGDIFWTARLSIILNTLSPPHKLFFHCYKKETPYQGFPWSLHEFPWETFLSYRSTWLPLWFQVSPFCKCVASSSLKIALHKEPSMTTCFSHSLCPSIRSNDRLTKILIQTNLTEAYQVENFLVTPLKILHQMR